MQIVPSPSVRWDPLHQIIQDARRPSKWGILEDSIPPAASLIGRQPGLWQKYWKYILSIAALLVLHKILIVYLLMERRRRRKSEYALREMTKRVIDAGEEERRHVARELHDDFCQRLSLLSCQIESISAESRPGDSEIQLDFGESVEELHALINDMHDLSHRLHSSKLEHLGLKVAMGELCRKLSQKHDMHIDLETDLSEMPPADVSLCLYRVAQEALSNVVRHSGAKSTKVILSENHGRLEMKIADSGRGFDPAAIPVGLGLTAMAERVRMTNGKFELRSAPGAGTTITTSIQLPKTSEPIPPGLNASSAIHS